MPRLRFSGSMNLAISKSRKYIFKISKLGGYYSIFYLGDAEVNDANIDWVSSFSSPVESFYKNWFTQRKYF